MDLLAPALLLHGNYLATIPFRRGRLPQPARPYMMAPDHPEEAFPLENRARIARAAGIIMLGNILSRLLGLVRVQVIAALFGIKIATDVFVAASTVPTMVYDLLISGVVSAALVPVFSEYADGKDKTEFSRVTSAVLTLAALALAVMVVLLIIVAPWLVSILAAGFDQEAQALTTHLVRLMLPSVLFMGMAGVLVATLYARQSFTLPAFSVAVYNVGIILGAVLLAGQLQVTSLAVGVLLGALLQVAIQWPGMRGLRLRPYFGLSHPGVRSILKLYAPVALGLVVSNSVVIIDRNLASGTGEGSIAAMYNATTLVQFPLGLVATATSYAVLPLLSRQARGDAETRGHGDAEKDSPLPLGEAWTGQRAGPRGEGSSTQNPEPLITHHSSLITHHSEYAATLRMGMKMILLLIVPAAVGLAVMREPVIRLLLERGAFDQNATALTALAFVGYSPGIAFAAVDQLLIFAFYARKDTRTPVLVGVMALFVYLAVALTLVRPLGMLGLVLANAAQNSSHALVLLWLMNRAVRGVLDRELGMFLVRVVGAALAMGLACQIFLVFASPLATSGPQVALLVVGGAGVGAVVYAAGVTVLRVREARELWRLLLGRLRRQKAAEIVVD